MNCPLCGGGNCQDKANTKSNAVVFSCTTYRRNIRLDSTAEIFRDENQQRKINNLIFEYVMRERRDDEQTAPWWFFFDPDYTTKEDDDPHRINLADIPYPNDLSEKADRILLNLYHIDSNYGHAFFMDPHIARALFSSSQEEESSFGIISIMMELKYLQSHTNGVFKIAGKGWQRIDELLRQNAEKRQAFIAMAFRDETKSIRDAFKRGISDAGYTSLAIDEKEHNNQIVPEIFDEINKSKFLVMDVTYPNYGAYYEAGYALGKGKQVIICCRKDAFDDSNNRPHFDIAQKSMIVWKDEGELVARLTKRIQATVK